MQFVHSTTAWIILSTKAKKIYEDLAEQGFVTIYDGSGSIGKRYRRQDERGCPLTVTVDYDSLKQKDVTVRDRDSMKQIRVSIKDLPKTLQDILSGELSFAKAGRLV